MFTNNDWRGVGGEYFAEEDISKTTSGVGGIFSWSGYKQTTSGRVREGWIFKIGLDLEKQYLNQKSVQMSQYLKVIAWNKNIIVSIHPSIHHSISQFKELWNVARFLWNLADISMLKRLIRARLSQTQQKIEITRSAIYCYSTEIFRFHRVLYFTWFIQTSKLSSVTCRSPPCWRWMRASIWTQSDILRNKQGEHRIFQNSNIAENGVLGSV